MYQSWTFGKSTYQEEEMESGYLDIEQHFATLWLKIDIQETLELLELKCEIIL